MATTTTTQKGPKAGARRAGTKKKEKKNVPHAVASIAATFNNTIVAITDSDSKDRAKGLRSRPRWRPRMPHNWRRSTACAPST